MARIHFLLLLLIPATSLAAEPDVEALTAERREKYEKAAAELPFFATFDHLNGRKITVDMPDDTPARYHDVLARLHLTHPRHISSEPLEADLALLEHDDPKVRTLALAALYAREDPRLLPHIHRMTEDGAETFPEPHEVESHDRKWPRYVEPKLTPQTVGSIAKRMIDFWRSRSRVHRESFDAYHGPRAARGSCAGWYATRLARRIGGISPIRQNRHGDIWALYDEIERDLPPVDQELTILLLFSPPDLAEILGERRIFRAARRLGPDRLMAVLDGEPPTDDPDIGPRPGYWTYEPMCRLILRHAKELLRPVDADRLLANPARKHEPLYAIAAAELVPARAKAILHAAFDAYSGEHDQEERARTVTALAQTFGDEEIDFLVEWVHTEPDEPSHYPPHRSLLLDLLLDRFEEGDRRILAAIVRDERYSRLDGRMLPVLARGLDANVLPRLFTEAELRSYNAYDTAGAKILADWRRRIRASLPEWAPTVD